LKSDLLSLTDLGGGINRSVNANAIADNQCSYIENFDVIESRLRRRGGIRRLMMRPFGPTAPFGSIPYQPTSTSVHGMHFFDSGVMLFGQYDRFGKKDGFGAVDINSGGVTVDTSLNPWSFVDNNGIVWGGRRGGGLWRITESFASHAGIIAPTVAMTSAHPNPGNVGVGTYKYVFTYVTFVGDESAQSLGNVVSPVVPSQVDLSGIVDSTQPQVIGKRIYRTLPNDLGTYWYVGTVPVGTTTFTDDVPNEELGDPLDADVILPPSECYSLAKWRNRLWAHNRIEVSCSKINRFETFDQTFDSFDCRGDREVRALHGWDNRLIVGTTEKLYQVLDTGFDEAGQRFDVQAFSLDHGCASHHSMKSSEGILFWLDRDGVYASGGGAPSCISTPYVRDIIRDADQDSLEHAIAYVDQARTEYAVSIGRPAASSLGGRLFDLQLVYNWRKNTWTTRRWTEDSNDGVGVLCAPAAMVQREDVTYVSFGTYNVYETNVGNRDSCYNDFQIEASARFKGIQENKARTQLRKVLVETVSCDEELTTRIYQDGRPAIAATNTSSLNATPNRDLKRFSVGTRTADWRPLCKYFELEIEYSGDTPIDINEVHFERDLFSNMGRSQ